jgi:CDP-2,3-bis-(O-geranylgeranyl)-sn-glycerol synthase
MAVMEGESGLALATLRVLYFFVPAYLANMAPVLVGNRLAALAVPLDFGASVGGVRVFGDHKTWRGLLVGVATGGVAFFLQRTLYGAGIGRVLALFDYATLPALTGAWLGLGAILGDAVKSFFKRRAGIAPGKPWIGPDEIDFYLGAMTVAACLAPLPLVPLLVSIPVVIAGHLLSNVIAWGLGLKDTWI